MKKYMLVPATFFLLVLYSLLAGIFGQGNTGARAFLLSPQWLMMTLGASGVLLAILLWNDLWSGISRWNRNRIIRKLERER